MERISEWRCNSETNRERSGPPRAPLLASLMTSLPIPSTYFSWASRLRPPGFVRLALRSRKEPSGRAGTYGGRTERVHVSSSSSHLSARDQVRGQFTRLVICPRLSLSYQ